MTRGLGLSLLAGLCLVAEISPARAADGDLLQPVGKTYLRTSVSWYDATEHFTPEGHLTAGDWWSPQASFSRTTLREVIEYGLQEDLTLVFDGVFKSLSVDRPGSTYGSDRVVGLGDVAGGARYRVRQGDVLATIQGRLEIPGGYDPERLDYALGSGGVNLEGRFQLAGDLGEWRPNYWTAEAGYRLRGNHYDDDLVYAGAVAIELIPRFWGKVGFDGIDNQGPPNQEVDITAADFTDPTLRASYTSFSAALRFVASPSLTVEAGISGEAAGKNTFHGSAVELAFELRP